MSEQRCRPNLDGSQRVALQVARQHFGEPAEVICDALMMRPRRSLRELQQDCPSLPLGQLRNGLLVLIQHNMVSAVVEASGKSKECRYTFVIAEAVLRLRFPKYSAYIRSIKEPVAESVVEAVLDHGRATWEQIQVACKDLPEQKVKEAGDFLIEGRYLTRVVGVVPGEDVPEQYDGGGSQVGGKRRASSPPAGQRAQKARRNVDFFGGEGIDCGNVLWRVNHEAFAWDLRGHAVGHFTKDQAGVESGSLMLTLMKAVRISALSHRMKPLSVDELLEEARNDPQSTNLTLSWESVSERLMALSQDGLVKKVNDMPGASTCFEPELKRLRQAIRRDIVERVVEAKMGWQARRVLGLLLHHQLLESKSVWDLAMLPKKDANEEVPRTADHSAQRTFFLWYVDLDQITRLVADDMLRSMHWLLLNREEKRIESDDLIGVGGDVSDLVAAPTQMQQYNNLQTSIERLEQAVLRLDETLLMLGED